MFSNSTNNIINPFAQLPSSSYHHPPASQPPVLSHDSNDIFLYHHHDLLPTSCLLPVNPQLTESLINMALLNNAIMTKQNGAGGPHGDCFGASGFDIPVKKPAKKDRHSKICTAQGVRDRRVRLSIEISRKFFDLQDLLGFDKASKTLEWLLTKSQTAIRELEKMKHGNGSNGGKRSSSSSPECEMVAENDGGEYEGTALKSKSVELEGVVSKEKKMKKLHKATVPLPIKESRAKARARARERTREKMCTSSTSNEWKRSCPDTSPQFLNQLRSLTQLELSKKSDHSYGHNMASSFKVHLVEASPRQLTSPTPAENVIEEEEQIVIKRKLKPSTILGYQQNLAAASKDVGCSSSGNSYFPNLPENWDINGACNGTL